MHHRVATERQCRDDWVVCGAILVRLDMDKYMGNLPSLLSATRELGKSANHDALAWKVLSVGVWVAISFFGHIVL
jgi:hypothetical protein